MAIALPSFGNTRTSLYGGGGDHTAFGTVPGPIGVPSSTYQQVGNALPALPQLTSSAGNVVGAELGGNLSPGTVNLLQDMAAKYGVSMGMPGMDPGTFNSSNFLRLLGTTSENLSHQGVGDFNSLIGSLAPTQIDPSLAAQISDRNATMEAAPDPAAAANQQLEVLKNLYQLGQSGPAGGTTVSPWGQNSSDVFRDGNVNLAHYQ